MMANSRKKAEPVTTETGSKDDLKTMSLEDLNNLLTEVLDSEDYIKAIAIRDEIKRRKSK
jgi:protein-arginine kinase activator protein McsA